MHTSGPAILAAGLVKRDGEMLVSTASSEAPMGVPWGLSNQNVAGKTTAVRVDAPPLDQLLGAHPA